MPCFRPTLMRLSPLFPAAFLLPEGIGLQLRGEAEEGGEAGLGAAGTGLSPGGDTH